ncbi:unnamed protein product [Rotaria socialis]|uniref:C-Maf-inducing protein PH domain-containing protein n=2 Tax=Rotaria socialis TaxID=392032 RepID=A0A820TZS7_9BILA|nr:unnamed protein product [Rotaria socialis]CAF3368541.1 unnamed protein product [Rotaria socialis]CAF3575965.1 unnamed protein product [Rotaria socialis]CAF3678539.1 unnamed protein product [Rotaria socialis]CAF4199610.1 unnamed protein product [Rotaria socialis]
MEDRLGSASNSLSLNRVDACNTFYSKINSEDILIVSPSNAVNTAAASPTTSSTLCMLINGRPIQQRYKLLNDGLMQVCRVPHARNIIEKIRFSRFLRRWEDHHLTLEHNEILSDTNEGYMDHPILYTSIEDMCPWSKTKMIDSKYRFCIRIVTTEYIYFFQVNTLYLRDQWFYSMQWKRNKLKFERILRTAHRPEILLKEMIHMIDFAMAIPIEDVEIYQFPLEIISEILQQQQFYLPRFVHENVIVSLAPLLEKHYPSPEICDFFSRHCRDSPRSQIVIEMFTPVVQIILKHNTDFGRYPRMRVFVQEYLVAINSQNDGLRIVQEFIKKMHGPTMVCPFPRVLTNFVSVCLAAIYNFFEDRKKCSFCLDDKESCRAYEEATESQLVCYTTMLQTMSTFDDWRPQLGLLLQSIPFPNEALTNDQFIEIFKNVVKNIVDDPRCEVHQTVLGIREGKNGWFEISCLGSIACDDDGEMYSHILSKLISCCCRKKRFLLSINKLLPALMLLALRENQSSLETLCAMLDLDAVENRDNKLQLISALQSTPTGSKLYAKVCDRQIALRELQQKGGPRKLTLPSRSTDGDLAKLLSSGSFGNLECLSLAFTHVTNACAEQLIKLPALRYLNLWSTQFGDAGLELISEHLNRLQVLNLCETQVTDKGLNYLVCMKMLRKLNLNSTHLSPITFEALKEKLPALQECDIRYTDAW